MTQRALLISLSIAALLGCKDTAKPTADKDAAVHDAAVHDAGKHDAGKADAGKRDAGRASGDDAGDEDGGADTCPTVTTTGTLDLMIEIDSDVSADVRVLRAGTIVGDALTASKSQALAAGRYSVEAHRVRKSGTLVGPAYQAAVGGGELCVHAGKTTSVSVTYTREPGSARLWLTQSNGSGAQVMAFDADQLAAIGAQTPSVSLSPALENAGPIRVDGKGRLWVGTNVGRLVGYNAARLGDTSTAAPEIVLQGASLCESAVPCGPTAIAFDARGALWVATLSRIVKLAPESLDRSGEPPAAVTIKSPDVKSPRGLAFDAKGNLWAADAEGAIAEFNASRLGADIDSAADVVIFAQQTGPVTSVFGEPEGLAVDADGNLWVGYFTGNDLVRFSKAELSASKLLADPIVPMTHIKIGVEALVTDLALDESGNLWLPGGSGAVYTIAKDQLGSDMPTLKKLSSAEIGSVERISFNTVPGPLFVAP